MVNGGIRSWYYFWSRTAAVFLFWYVLSVMTPGSFDHLELGSQPEREREREINK